MKKFKIGAKVSVLDEAIYGKIITKNGNEIVILTSDGFEMVFSENELVVEEIITSDKLSKGIENTIQAEQNSIRKKTKEKIAKKGIVPPMEVDLHIEKILKNFKHLSNFQLLTMQLDTAKHKLEFAITKKIQRVIFIHGVGEGVLRTELEFLVNRFDGLKYYEADYKKYGNGALEVYIPQNVMKN
ncbi:MAG: Smr/MutS family protein [Flavobacteriaceae bacterium]|nr:Smr/MutS family protein [Flavobacteriaceae bacterium]